ncbi:hypothetical protein FIS3754_01300 [Fischerella sp. NIES-3754]|nr:hypothetical protein FIS3754_01300 [Fischerella sp. NIES-3754]BCX06670.1 MAG: hypothetical protein KatS3mg066_0529 [Fischerella sp.]
MVAYEYVYLNSVTSDQGRGGGQNLRYQSILV